MTGDSENLLTSQQGQQPAERDERHARLDALMFALRVHDFVADWVNPLRIRVSQEGTPGIEIDIICTRRASDGGKLWYLGRNDYPLAPADNITEALVAVKGQTAVRL